MTFNIVKYITNIYYHAYVLMQQYYPFAVVQNAEKIYILESANYTSTIFKNTMGAGSIAFSTVFPFGWNQMQNFWGSKFWLIPGVYISTNGNNYLKFPTFTAGLAMVCEFLQQNGNNPAAWNSKDPTAQSIYQSSLNGITNKYVV